MNAKERTVDRYLGGGGNRYEIVTEGYKNQNDFKILSPCDQKNTI